MQHRPKNLICHECDYQTPRRDNMRRHLQMVHRLVKVGEILDSLKEVCISNRPFQVDKATKDKLKKPKPSIITVKLPAPNNDAPRKSTYKTNKKNLATPLNTQKQFHTKPIKKLPKRHKKDDTTSTPVTEIPDTFPSTISSTLIDSLDSSADTSTLIDSLDNPSLDTPVLLDTPTQQQEFQDWCILDSIGTTDELLFV